MQNKLGQLVENGPRYDHKTLKKTKLEPWLIQKKLLFMFKVPNISKHPYPMICKTNWVN